MAATPLFEDIFKVKEKDPEGKRFERVSRLICLSENYEMEMALDVATQLYPMALNERFSVVLTTTLHEDGTVDNAMRPVYDQSGKPTIADRYEYVMHGKIYKVEETTENGAVKLAVYVSYGGLLMRLKGDSRDLEGIRLDSHIYLLLNKLEGY